VHGRFDREITRASGLPVDGGESQQDVDGLPRPMRWLPPIDAKEKAAMLSLTRQRAEALFMLDQQIGKLVTTLEKTGELDNTVLMFTSDNGYFLGEHRMRQGKIWTHEPSLRVPFVVTGAGSRAERATTRSPPRTSPRPSSTSAVPAHLGPPTASPSLDVRPGPRVAAARPGGEPGRRTRAERRPVRGTDRLPQHPDRHGAAHRPLEVRPLHRR
jgi:hypothetical protein